MTAVPKIQINDVSVYLLPVAQALENWDSTYSGLIAQALDKSPIASDNADAVLDKLQRGEAGLMIVERGGETAAVAVLEMAGGKQGTLLHVYALTGVRQELWMQEFVDALDKVAQALGAVAVSMTGRPGWARMLPQYGFRTELVTMTMRVK